MANSNWDPWTYRDRARWRTESGADATGSTGRTGSTDDVATPDALSSDLEGGMGSGTADPSVTGGSAVGGGRELVGFRVEATDGHIGKVDQDTQDVAASYLVIDTGPWIFGRKVMLPAGTVERVDWEDERVYVDRTKQQVKDSPELDVDAMDAGGRDRVGDYWSGTYGGPMP